MMLGKEGGGDDKEEEEDDDEEEEEMMMMRRRMMMMRRRREPSMIWIDAPRLGSLGIDRFVQRSMDIYKSSSSQSGHAIG